jgi:NadR type nicotinamide-nucleotide adenylyltransferase
MKTGLTLGKYAPLHAGHQLVIETAMAEMDAVNVVIYDAPDTTEIPLELRARWLRTLYPSVQVIEAWGGPSEVGYTSEIMQAHERYLIEDLAVSGITHFYSSEPYGEHMSRALGAIDRRVDDMRIQVPVAARDVRRDPYAYRHLMPTLVYRDLVINVVFVGAPCTGKSTLARRLAQLHETRWMPEYGREYWEEHEMKRRLTPAQLVELAESHLEREDKLLDESNRYLFTDTNAVTTATFARYYHGAVDACLASIVRRAAPRYDLTFLCDVDIPYDDTWDRSGDVSRVVFQRQVIGDLSGQNIPFITLHGPLEARVEQVNGVLRRYRKYMNPFELFSNH